MYFYAIFPYKLMAIYIPIDHLGAKFVLTTSII